MFILNGYDRKTNVSSPWTSCCTWFGKKWKGLKNFWGWKICSFFWTINKLIKHKSCSLWQLKNTTESLLKKHKIEQIFLPSSTCWWLFLHMFYYHNYHYFVQYLLSNSFIYSFSIHLSICVFIFSFLFVFFSFCFIVVKTTLTVFLSEILSVMSLFYLVKTSTEILSLMSLLYLVKTSTWKSMTVPLSLPSASHTTPNKTWFKVDFKLSLL